MEANSMVEVQGLAASFAAVCAVALVCAVFFPVLVRKLPPINRVLKKAEPEQRNVENASTLRIQENVLKAVREDKHSRFSSWLETSLTASGLKCSPRHFIAMWLGAGFAIFGIGILAGVTPLVMQGVAILVMILPPRLLVYLAERRRRTFLVGFTEAVEMVLRGAKSGLSIADCLNIVAHDGAPLIRKEFSAIVAQLRAGVPVSEAMLRLTTAMPLPDVRFFALIMSLQSQTGGNLSEALGNLVNVLRSRQKLAAKVRIASAEVKTSAITIGSLPLLVVAATMFVAPDYIALLWESESGRRILTFSATWMIIGILVLKRMAQIRV
jgi:tight adherence protein B